MTYPGLVQKLLFFSAISYKSLIKCTPSPLTIAHKNTESSSVTA